VIRARISWEEDKTNLKQLAFREVDAEDENLPEIVNSMYSLCRLHYAGAKRCVALGRRGCPSLTIVDDDQLW
jgi:hypothetical protein